MVAIDHLSVRLRDHLLDQHGYGCPSIIITIILDLVVGLLVLGHWSLVFVLPGFSSEFVFRDYLPKFSTEFLFRVSLGPILAHLGEMR